MFKASTDTQLPTTNMRILSENGREFSDGQLAEFFLPPSLGYCSFGNGGSEAFLRFNLKYSTTQTYTPEGGVQVTASPPLRVAPPRDKGVSSLIQVLRIADGKTNQLLEEIMDYDILASALISTDCGEGDGVWERRSVVEGLCSNKDNVTPFTSSNRVFNDPLTSQAAQQINGKVCLPFHLSGILNSRRVFNVGGTSGLRVSIVLQDGNTASVLRTPDAEKSMTLGVATIAGLVTTLDLQASAYGVNSEEDLDTCPFVIGQAVELNDNAGNTNTSNAIAGLSIVGGFLRLSFGAGFTTTQIFPVGSSVYTGGVVTASYLMSEVEMIVPSVEVPAAVSEKFNKELLGEGASVDVFNWSLYRFNLNAGETQSNVTIPMIQSRAKGIVSVPYQPKTASVFSYDRKGEFDGFKKYYYTYSSLRHPQQGVNLTKENNGTSGGELLIESENAFNTCFGDNMYRNGEGWTNKWKSLCFFVGRSLSRYGGSFDSRGNNVSLYIESDGLSAQTQVNSYVCSVKRIIMRADGVELIN